MHRLDIGMREKQCQPQRDDAADYGQPFAPGHELRVADLFALEAQIEVSGQRSRRGVEIRRQRCERRREDGGQQQTADTRRQAGCDEHREDRVVLGNRHIQTLRMAAEVGEESGTDRVEQGPGDKRDRDAEEDTAHRRTFVLGRHETLQHALVTGVGVEVRDKPADEHHPEDRCRQIPREIEHVEFVVFPRDREETRPAAIRPRDQDRHCHGDTGDQDNALVKIAPHDPFDPAGDAVQNRDNGQPDDCRIQRNRGDLRNRERGQKDYERGAEQLKPEKAALAKRRQARLKRASRYSYALVKFNRRKNGR